MEYFSILNSINIVSVAQTTSEAVSLADSSVDKLTISENFISTITAFIVAITGVIGISYINKIKEKRYNATFSFCARLKIRLHIIKDLLDNHKDFMLDQLLPVSSRKKTDISEQSVVKNAKNLMHETVCETIEFLKNSDDQMPAAEGWSKKCTILFEFLEDFSRMSDEYEHLKWPKDQFETKKEEYYDLHYSNITSMINDIENQQVEIESKIFNYRFINFLKNAYKKIKK